jgi:hypothetical protein
MEQASQATRTRSSSTAACPASCRLHVCVESPSEITIRLQARATTRIVGAGRNDGRQRLRKRVVDVAIGVTTAATIAALRKLGVWP